MHKKDNLETSKEIKEVFKKVYYNLERMQYIVKDLSLQYVVKDLSKTIILDNNQNQLPHGKDD